MIIPNYGNGYKSYVTLLELYKKKTLEKIKEKLDQINWEDVLLFGFTSKFYQWVPAIIVAEEIKKRNPNIQIILGGFGNQEAAKEILKKCCHFDFSTWGEGEYTLLRLVEKITANETNYKEVPRLAYREGQELLVSECNTGDYLDFKNYPLPLHDDYQKEFAATNLKGKSRYPINSVRGCNWSACKFCNYNQGYKYRSREPEDIVNEIVGLKEKYDAYAFYFVDNDMFCNHKRFNQLLDLIIETKRKRGYQLSFWGEMIPSSSLHEETFKKMLAAGFNNLFIGYEALTDVLLKKMNKRSTFAENILFVKFATKYKINLDVNIIRDIPQETEEDVQESIRNLHYLRFYFNREPKFFHRKITLNITTDTHYFKEISEDERKLFDFSQIAYLLPEHFNSDGDRFNLSRWNKSKITNYQEWDRFGVIENSYQKQSYEYEVEEAGTTFTYTEKLNNNKIKFIRLSRLQHAILKNCNQKINDIDSLSSQLNSENIDEIKLEVDFLASNYLLYRNSGYSQLVSVIDIGRTSQNYNGETPPLKPPLPE